jgi:crotonobetainyl-CoA:carnitine CoA-transferase CaiB-like acyl-CoA transferase
MPGCQPSRPVGRVRQLVRHVGAEATAERMIEANPHPLEGGPLAGVVLLDLTQMVSGPMGTQIIADQGADVIKIENTTTGAAERGGARSTMTNPLMSVINRNKRSLALDLKSKAGHAVFLRLVQTADVVVQNFRPGVMDRMGIGYDALCEVNPSIILVSISGFGQTGPYSQKRVYDPVIQSVSGLASIQADENDRPRMMRLIVPDKVTALTSAQAISTALVQKYRTGKGTHIELAMLDATLSFAWGEGMARYGFVDDADSSETADDPDVNPHEYVRDMVFRTKDGYITCGAVQQKEWEGLCAALDKPEWLTDERFATAAARNENRDERLRLTEEILMTMTAAEATEKLNAQQVPNGPVHHPRGKVVSDPQVLHNDLLVNYRHDAAPLTLRQPRPAAKFPETTGGAWLVRRLHRSAHIRSQPR